MSFFKNKYFLIQFANRKHSKVLRFFLASVGWIAIMISGAGFKISRICFNHLYSESSLKASLRRLAWYLKTGPFQIHLINDPNFDITEGINDSNELQYLKHYLLKRLKKQPNNFSLFADQLYVDAAILHFHAKEGHLNTKVLNNFYLHANKILQYAGTPPSHYQMPVHTTQTVTKTSKKFIEAATHSLQVFSQHISNQDYPWYVVSGTFLGLHREGRFLPHDYDIDLGINAHEINLTQLISLVQTLPEHTIKTIYFIPQLSIGATLDYHEKVGIIKLVHQSGVQIDLFIHYQKKDKLLHGSRIHMWQNSLFGLEHKNLSGIDVLAPDNPDIYLRENYGQWEKPVTNFNCSTDTPNMTITQNFYAVAFFLRKLITHYQSGELNAWHNTWNILQREGVVSNQKINHSFFTRPL